MNLSAFSTMQLIVELMHDGRAGLFPELLASEPLDVALIVKELQTRTMQNFSAEPRLWVNWFTESSSATESEKETLRLMQEFKTAQDPIVDRILKRRRGSEPDA